MRVMGLPLICCLERGCCGVALVGRCCRPAILASPQIDQIESCPQSFVGRALLPVRESVRFHRMTVAIVCRWGAELVLGHNGTEDNSAGGGMAPRAARRVGLGISEAKCS